MVALLLGSLELYVTPFMLDESSTRLHTTRGGGFAQGGKELVLVTPPF